MIRPRTPDEALVVDVARGLDSGSMIEQAYRILRQVPYSVGYHREEAMWRALCGCAWLKMMTGYKGSNASAPHAVIASVRERAVYSSIMTQSCLRRRQVRPVSVEILRLLAPSPTSSS